jgi:hypothetical protein
MSRHASKLTSALLSVVALGAVAPSVAAQEPAPPRLLRFDRYYDSAELGRALRLLQERYPSLCALRSMGKSLEGRPLWVLSIRNPTTGPESEKAAIYVDGNTHGNEIQGAEVCLFLAHHLLTRYASSESVRRLVDERVFYIAPTVNPDGRESFLKTPHTAHSSRRNRRPDDADRDGRIDEDGADDIDGDGRILRMRVRDRLGRYKVGADPRLMERCEADEPGTFRLLGWEGIDNDGDGRFNEDSVGGVDLNRNFPSDWLPEHRQSGAGDYPLSEPETRATADFVLAHPNIAAIQSFHNAGDMILRPPGAEDDRRVPREDLRLYDALGRRGERTLPGYRYLQTFKDLYAVHGAFLDWGYMRLGVYSFSNELWSMPRDYDKSGSVSDLERLRWNDEMLEGRGFVPWYRVKHPQLGEVELGGWTKLAPRVPPLWMLEEVCYRNTRFVLYHADMMPKLAITRLEARLEPGETDVYRVEAVIENRGYMATVTERGRVVKASRPDRLSVSGESLKVLAVSRGGRTARRLELQATKRPWRLEFDRMRGRSGVRVVWLVKGRGRAQVTYRSDKGGVARRSVLLGV